MRSTLALAVLCACGRLGFDPSTDGGDDTFPILDPPARWVDGSRLRAIPMQADGGSLLHTWHDTQLGVDCWFREASDGAIRCLPQQPNLGTTFSDATCMTSVAPAITALLTCGVPGTFAVSADQDHIHRLGAQVTGPIYQPGNGCTLRSEPWPTTYFDVGPVEPLTTFVAATEMTTRSGTKSYVEIVAEDGSRELQNAIIDHARNDARCTWQEMSDRELVCVDEGLGAASWSYSDPACTNPILVVNDSAPARLVSYLRDVELCTDRIRMFERGAPYGGAVYEWNTSRCDPRALSAGQSAFEVGAEHTAEYPRLALTLSPGPSRTRDMRWRDADGFEWPDRDYLWDTETDSRCAPTVSSPTNTLICSPRWSTTYGAVFTDAACTNAVSFVMASCSEKRGAVHFPPISAPTFTCDGFAQDIKPFTADLGLARAWGHRVTGGCVELDLATAGVHRMEQTTPLDASDYPPMTQLR